MTLASNPPMRRTGGGAGGDPIPFSVQTLTLPQGWRLEPRQGGALEKVARTHGVAPAAMQELLNLHIEHVKSLADAEEAHRYDFYREEARRFNATAGSAERLKAAKGLLAAYKQAQGTEAHSAVMAALERDAGHHAAVLNFLAWAASHGVRGGSSMSKGARRYGLRSVMARIIAVVQDWLRPLPAPACARQEGSAND